ncbi:MAG: hypothetical protein AAF371_17600 [Pseudomonadota bacterium]
MRADRYAGEGKGRAQAVTPGAGEAPSRATGEHARRPTRRVVGLGAALAGALALAAVAYPAAAAGIAPPPPAVLASLEPGWSSFGQRSDAADAATAVGGAGVRVAGFGPPLVLLEEDGPLAPPNAVFFAGTGSSTTADRMLALAAFLSALGLLRLSSMRMR